MTPRLWLRIEAPFAAFWGPDLGGYRMTLPTMPPSAAWGLLLALAGRSTPDCACPSGRMLDRRCPPLRLALGELRTPAVSSTLRLAHSYPVGQSGTGRPKPTKKHGAQAAKEPVPTVDLRALQAGGQKYWIAPVRCEVLAGLDVVLGAEGDEELLTDLARGVRGEALPGAWGLPCAGGSDLLLDHVALLDEPPPETRWWARLDPDTPPRPRSARFPVHVDREEDGRSTSVLLAPTREGSRTPPSSAWIWVL